MCQRIGVRFPFAIDRQTYHYARVSPFSRRGFQRGRVQTVEEPFNYILKYLYAREYKSNRFIKGEASGLARTWPRETRPSSKDRAILRMVARVCKKGRKRERERERETLTVQRYPSLSLSLSLSLLILSIFSCLAALLISSRQLASPLC